MPSDSPVLDEMNRKQYAKSLATSLDQLAAFRFTLKDEQLPEDVLELLRMTSRHLRAEEQHHKPPSWFDQLCLAKKRHNPKGTP
jgi:hypothetical protein